MKRLFALLLLAVTLMAAPVCAQPVIEEDAPIPLPVVASFSILGDMVRAVGGEVVTVKTLVGPDADAHGFQPSPDDIRSLGKARMIVMNGLGFEGWLPRLVESAQFKYPVVSVSKGFMPMLMSETEESHDHDHEHDALDPHAWQDVAKARIYAHNIAVALALAIPSEAEHIRARAKAYDAELAELDEWIKKSIGEIPESDRKIVTSHDAFGYFGAAYGVTFLAPQGMSTETEPTAADVAKLIAQIKKEGIHTLFIENMTNPRLITQIAKDTGATLGDPLYADALSIPTGPAPTYITMMRNNVTLMLAAMKKKQ